jgi:uncharacterized protein YggT (Ycf19 family)
MDPREPVRPVEDDQPTERVEPVEPAEPAEPARPVEPAEYRREVVRTEEVSPASRIAQIVYVVFGIVIALIIIRVILKALAANTGAAFTGFIYGVTDPLVAPFQGIFATPPPSNGSVFEFSSVVAIVVYALVAWAIVRLIEIAGGRRTTTSY